MAHTTDIHSYLSKTVSSQWMPQEFATSHVSLKERGKRIEEYIEALRAIWRPDPISFEGNFYHIPASLIIPIASTFAALKSAVTAFHSAAQEAGRDPSTLKVFVSANAPMTTTPLPDGRHPFLGGSPEQIA